MVDRMHILKERLLDHIEAEAQDLNRVNVNELGEFVDMVKDLAESIEHCKEAAYYESITEAMGKHGTSRTPVIKDDLDDDVLEKLASEYHTLSRDDRMAMKSRVLTILGIK